MSKIDYCPKGGQGGICVSRAELKKFAKKLGNEFIDQIIPLPVHEQPETSKCQSDHDEIGNWTYWETDTGSHGWCCGTCGKVLQWG